MKVAESAGGVFFYAAVSEIAEENTHDSHPLPSAHISSGITPCKGGIIIRGPILGIGVRGGPGYDLCASSLLIGARSGPKPNVVAPPEALEAGT